MKLIVGLGNPGTKYAQNRHNVGFLAVDRLHDIYQFQPWRTRFSGEIAEGRIGNDKCLLLKPLTYMNESGRSVGEALRFFKLDLEDVIVIYDEIDLAPGKLKVKTGGGNAGHNGLRSLSAHIGNDYCRVRIGVGRPADKAQVASFVLHDFARADRVWLEPLLEAIARSIADLVRGDAGKFCSEVAKRIAPDEPEKKQPETAPKPAMNVDKGRDLEQDDANEGGPFTDLLRRWIQSKQDGE